MKLKKIIASLTAAAMAVTTMAFAPLSVSAATENNVVVASDVSIASWGNSNIDLTIKGKPTDSATVTIEIGKTVTETNGWSDQKIFNILASDWSKTYASEALNGNETAQAGTKYTYSIKNDLDGANTIIIQGGAFDNIYTVTVSEVAADTRKETNASYDGSPITMKKMSPNWCPTGTAQGEYVLTVPGVTYGVTTLGELKAEYKRINVDGLAYVSDSLDIGASAFIYCIYAKLGDDGSVWGGTGGAQSFANSCTFVVDSINGDDSLVISEIGIQVNVADTSNLPSAIAALKDDETFEINPVSTVKVKSVNVTPSTAALVVGDTTTLKAEVLPADATDPTITWKSSDETVATVDQNGKVTAKAAGTATIKAVSNANDTIYDSCEVTVKKNTYAVTVKSNNDAYGTASANVKEAAENDTVELSYTAAKGYKFSKWESEDVTVAKDGTFTMPAKEVTVTAVFEELPPDEYAINITKPVNGKVSVKDGASSAVKNTVIDLVITPDKGYEVDTVKVNGEAITGTSFTMPEKDVTVEVTFKKSTYTVTVAAAANGTVTVDKASAQMGDTVTVTATPDTDYELSKITVNGTAITGNTFTMPAENVTIAAEFKKIGSAGAEVVVPEGVSVSFAGSKEDILKAVFGDDYAALVEAGYKLDVVMTVKDETAVSAEDKALVEGALSGDMHIGLLIDVSLVMTKDGVSTVVENSSKPVSFAIGVPDSIIADGRTYSVIRVHNGAAEDIGGTYDAANKTITVASDKYSTYAVVYKDAPAPQPEPTVTYYPITADRNVTLTASSAAAGTQINVRVDFGYDAYVYCGGRVIDKITEGGSFTMPAGNVTIVTKANGYLAMIKNAAPNSYIFVYDADMNYIKTNGSVKGIKGEGKVTVKLGEEYAGKTVTLYKGRKSTSVKLDSLTLDENGNATFTVEGGKNYTAVVE